jgi:drug/metabolite transporter (DMT)-like permease
MWLLTKISPNRLGTYAYVNPVIAVFLGWVLVGEPLTAQTLVAAAVIIGAVFLITTAQSNSSIDEKPSVRQVVGTRLKMLKSVASSIIGG